LTEQVQKEKGQKQDAEGEDAGSPKTQTPKNSGWVGLKEGGLEETKDFGATNPFFPIPDHNHSIVPNM
jgi:hypothetical protein